MYKNATKCNETIGKWCKTKHGASKIIDTFETYHCVVCRFHIATGWRRANKKSLTAPLLEHHAASGHHLQLFGFLLLDWLHWFLTEGKACCYIHHTILLGFSNWPVIYSASSEWHTQPTTWLQNLLVRAKIEKTNIIPPASKKTTIGLASFNYFHK
jgi:hypothetical protein